MKVLSLGGVAGPTIFVVVVIICGALRPEYSHVSQFVSELGATGTPQAGLMNFAGFLPTGLLIAGLGVSLARLLPYGRVSALASVFIGCFGLGLVVAGLHPCEPGCPQEEPTLHDAVSFAAFVLGIGGSALFAHICRKSSGWRGLGVYSAVSSASALAFLVALASSIEARVLTGLWQRLLIGTLFLWCAIVGLQAFRLSGKGRGGLAGS